MRPRRGGNRTRSSRIGLDSMAGWLFADLLLVLFLVGLGTELTATADPVPPPMEEPAPKPEPEPESPPGMRLDAELVQFDVNADALLADGTAEQKTERDRVSKLIRRITDDLKDSRAAMVILWGQAREPQRGQDLARAVQPLLQVARPDVFGENASKALWNGKNPQDGRVELEIYLFEEQPASKNGR